MYFCLYVILHINFLYFSSVWFIASIFVEASRIVCFCLLNFHICCCFCCYFFNFVVLSCRQFMSFSDSLLTFVKFTTNTSFSVFLVCLILFVSINLSVCSCKSGCMSFLVICKIFLYKFVCILKISCTYLYFINAFLHHLV